MSGEVLGWEKCCTLDEVGREGQKVRFSIVLDGRIKKGQSIRAWAGASPERLVSKVGLNQ
jgi:hypothetical protein